MSLNEKLQLHKLAINDYLAAFLQQQRSAMGDVNRWGEDVIDRMSGFVGQGKVLRGSLVVLSSEMYGQSVTEKTLAMAAAVELIHASLLVHDDIMDNDRLRRGQPTIFAQYETVGLAAKSQQSMAYGQALATCFGDLGFFLAWQLISRSGAMSVELNNLFGQEMAAVCLAQMEDVASGMTDVELTEAEILEIYRYKTARYTFSLPLMCGAMLVGQSIETLKKLEELGEYLGLMFQVKDDELGLFGESVQTGKPVGSDIMENKKTLQRLLLLERAGTHRSRLEQLFGSKTITAADLSLIRTLIIDLGVQQTISEKVTGWAEKAQLLIVDLNVAPEEIDWLTEMVMFNQLRTK